MAFWNPKRAPLFSPRAAKEPTKLVEEVRTGPNTFRFIKAKEPTYLETGMMNQGLTYREYKKELKAQKKADRVAGYAPKNREHYSRPEFNYDSYASEIETYTSTKPTYGWSANRWSNWSYNSFYNTDTEDNTNLFVKDPSNYLTPTTVQIRAKTNYWTHEDITRIKELARVCYFKMIDERDYISSDYADQSNCRLSPDTWQKKKDLFDNVYNTYIPGFTPLEQAIAINHKVRDDESRRNTNKGSMRGRSGGFEFKRSDYSDPAVNNQLDMNELSKQYKLDILNKISIIGDLGTQFKVERATGEKEVANSDMFRKKPMRSYDQIRMIEMYQRFLPNYEIKFLTKDLLVNVPVQSSEKKQKIIILCDYSGSMNENEKQIWVNAILIDRFRYVIKGEAEVYFSHFVSSPSGLRFHHIKNEQDVIKFWKTFSNFPSGSYTNIGRIVEYVSEEVKKGTFHNLKLDLSKEQPEILIINDGQDEVGYDAFPYRVNAVSLMQFSNELKDLCVATGGKQVRISQWNKITAYSNTGEEIIAN